MGRAKRLQPIEIVRAVGELSTAPSPALAPRPRIAPRRPWTLRLGLGDVLALSAFGLAAVVLAWVAGRATPTQPRPTPLLARNLEDLRRWPPITYQELSVDRGDLEPPADRHTSQGDAVP